MNAAEFDAEKHKLTVEIFELTGQKVSVDDPIVTAAFFYSGKMRQAAAECDSASKMAHQRITRATAEVSDAGIAKLKTDFYRISREVLEQVRTEATTANPNAMTIRATVATAFMMAIGIGALAGAMVTAMYLEKNPPLPASIPKEAAIGRALLRALPELDKSTKHSLLKIIGTKGG